MMIENNISLKQFNTFQIDVSAKHFAAFRTLENLETVLKEKSKEKFLILGGGSNILFTKDFDGLVLKNEIRGIEEIHEDENFIYLKVGAGENWHQFVRHAVRKNWGGIENLSLIPGTVGATPIQNIGAYGVELETVFWSLEALHLKEKKVVTLTKSDCSFGYRNSVFKNKYKGQFAILNCTFQLKKKPKFNTSYGAIVQELEKMKINKLNIEAISNAVIQIRSAKLPDPALIGNAGSFFKNPIIDIEKYKKLKIQFPEIVAYPSGDEMKIAAGWLIEQCGWKNKRSGSVGCFDKQALVIVNFGDATGAEVFDFSAQIIKSVKDKFTIELEREVNIL